MMRADPTAGPDLSLAVFARKIKFLIFHPTVGRTDKLEKTTDPSPSLKFLAWDWIFLVDWVAA